MLVRLPLPPPQPHQEEEEEAGAAKTKTAIAAGDALNLVWQPQQLIQMQKAATDNTTFDMVQDQGNGNGTAKHTAGGVQINGTSKRKRPEEVIAMLQQELNQPRDGDGGEAPLEKGRGAARG